MNAHEKTQRFVDDRIKTATAGGDVGCGIAAAAILAFVAGAIFVFVKLASM